MEGERVGRGDRGRRGGRISDSMREGTKGEQTEEGRKKLTMDDESISIKTQGS